MPASATVVRNSGDRFGMRLTSPGRSHADKGGPAGPVRCGVHDSIEANGGGYVGTDRQPGTDAQPPDRRTSENASSSLRAEGQAFHPGPEVREPAAHGRR